MCGGRTTIRRSPICRFCRTVRNRLPHVVRNRTGYQIFTRSAGGRYILSPCFTPKAE